MKWKWVPSWRGLVLLAVAGLLTAEIGLRFLLDFPLYGADAEVGYFVRPSQHGAFLGKNDWVFNRQGMGVAEDFAPSGKLDVLLVGDSIVSGGNPLPQKGKLGPSLEAHTQWQVWPISAGSWAMQNELTYLKRIQPAVGGSDVIVFVFNSEDFGKPSSWSSEYTHPRSHPASYLLYLAGKLRGGKAKVPSGLLVPPSRDLGGDWRRFVSAARHPIVVIGYPHKAERLERCGWVPQWVRITGSFACFGEGGDLTESDFRDDIHPSPSGTRKLVALISRQVRAVAPASAMPER